MNVRKSLSKRHVIKEIAKITGLTQKDTKAVVDNMLGIVMELVSLGDRVTLAGFGAFSASKRKARKAMNPYSGEKINVPEKKVPKFTAGANFRKKVNKQSMSDKEKKEIADYMREFFKKC